MKEDDLESCTKEQRDFFMCNIRARETLLLALPENEYTQIKLPNTSHEIWKHVESN